MAYIREGQIHSRMLLSGFEHQVAGHVEQTILGVGGRFILKPMVKKELFYREAAFYERTLQSAHSPNSAVRFTPQYYGLLHCKTGDSNGGLSEVDGPMESETEETLPHLVLEDLTFNYSMPNIIDIKMGTCTFEPTATKKKKENEIKKYPYQSELGFRITGFKVFERGSGMYIKSGKAFGRSVVPAEAVGALAMLFDDGTGVIRMDVLVALLDELEKLLVWVREQTQHRFFCSSLLIVYDALGNNSSHMPVSVEKDVVYNSWRSLSACISEDSKSPAILERMERVLQNTDNNGDLPTPVVRVKMIDFAHVVEVGSSLDCGAEPGWRGGASAFDVNVSVHGDVNADVNIDKDTSTGEVEAKGNGETSGIVDEGYVLGLSRLIAHLRCVVAEAGGVPPVETHRSPSASAPTPIGVTVTVTATEEAASGGCIAKEIMGIECGRSVREEVRHTSCSGENSADLQKRIKQMRQRVVRLMSL